MQAFVCCTSCGQESSVGEHLLGQEILCTNCGTPFVAQANESRETGSVPSIGDVAEKKPGAEAAPAASIPVNCTNCAKKVRVAEEWIGRTVKCPKCQQNFIARRAPKTLLARAVIEAPTDPDAGPTPSRGVGPNGGPAAARRGDRRRGNVPPAPLAKKGVTTVEQEAREILRQAAEPNLPQLRFAVTILSDPDGIMRGRYEAEVTEEGLRLWRGKAAEQVIPVNSPAEYLGDNCLAVIWGARRIELAVVKWGANQQKLAEDVAALLNREKNWKLLIPSNYTLPVYLYLPPVVALGIPVLAIVKGLPPEGAIGGAVWAGLGVGLAGACVGLLQREEWTVERRLRTAVGVVGGGYLILLLALLIGTRLPSGVSAEWKEFANDDGRFQVQMPGPVKESSRTQELTAGGEVSVRQFRAATENPPLTFSVEYYDLPSQRLKRDAFFRDEVPAALRTDFRGGKAGKGKDTNLDGHAAVQYDVEWPGEERTAQRIIALRDSRVYQVTVERQTTGHSTEMRKFLDSFKFLAAPPTVDLRFVAKEGSFLAAAADPDARLAFFADETDSGRLRLTSLPNFEPLDSRPYFFGGVPYQAALDRKRGLLYLAMSEPRKLRPGPAFGRHKRLGQGDLHVYDVKAVRPVEQSLKENLKQPVVIPLGGATVAGLALSPDGRWLYYLDVQDPTNARLGRIDTTSRAKAPELTLEKRTETFRLSRDGSKLYALASPDGHQEGAKGVLQIIDVSAETMKPEAKVPLPVDPFDLDVTSDGIAYVTAGSTGRLLVVNLKARSVEPQAGPERLGRSSYVTLSRDQKRLYLGDHEDTGLPRIRSLQLPDDPTEELRGAKTVSRTAERDYPLGGPLLLTPDGKFLLCRTGTVLQVDPGSPGE